MSNKLLYKILLASAIVPMIFAILNFTLFYNKPINVFVGFVCLIAGGINLYHYFNLKNLEKILADLKKRNYGS